MKRVLIVSSSFWPDNRMGAVRPTKLAKYLERMGYTVTVITTTPDGTFDRTSVLNVENGTRVFRVHRGVFFNTIFGRVRDRMVRKRPTSTYLVQKKQSALSSIRSGIMKASFEAYQFAEMIDWHHQVRRIMKKYMAAERFDVVISSYPKLGAHYIASKLLKEGVVDNWIADFRDPVAYETLESGFLSKVKIHIQQSICSTANIVTYVAEEMVDKLRNGIGDQDKFFCVPNGFDDEDIMHIEESETIEQEYADVLKISYAGSLYGGKRDVSALFAQLSSLIEQGTLDKEKVRFFYAGREFEELMKQASSHGMEDILVDCGYVSREKSLAIQQQSNLLVVSTWNTEHDRGVVPGKVYECFLLNKPTLVIVNGTVPNSELGNMVTAAGLGIVYDTMVDSQTNIECFRRFLVDIYKAAISLTRYELNTDQKYLESYRYESIVIRLAKIIEDL